MTSKSKKGPKSFLAGATAGACEILVTMPLDVIKTQMQVNRGLYKHPLHAGQEIVRQGGFRALYYGMPAFLTQTSGKAAIRFTAFEYIKQRISEGMHKADMDPNEYKTLVSLLSGLGAGTVEALVWTTPTERMKVLRQTEVGSTSAKYDSMIGGIRSILREQGVAGLYKGAVPTALRQASSVGVRFMAYDSTKSFIYRISGRDESIPNTTISLLAGGTVGAISVIINNPVDVIKSSLQSKNSQYTGTLDCATSILRVNGPMGFFGGLTARVPRVFCGQAITFAVYERVMKLLDDSK